MKFFVYILQCVDGSLYTGITNDVEKRLATHRSGKGSKYVRAHLPVELIYSEECENKIEAAKREAEIKSWSRQDKIKNLNLVISRV